MREGLKVINGKRILVYATVSRFGSKKNWHGFPQMTVCFVDVKDEQGNDLCDHIWLVAGKQIMELGLGEGNRVCFEARVKPYLKGYRGRREDVYDSPVQRDYKLSNPRKFVKITSNTNQMELF